MGLDTSHDAFHGAYSAFNRFRQAVAAAMGGSWPPHKDPKLKDTEWYWGRGFDEKTHPGLFVLMSHSDCDGVISPTDCELVANDLASLLPAIGEMGRGSGHVESQGGYGAVTRQFIAGCRAAHAAGEDLEFH